MERVEEHRFTDLEKPTPEQRDQSAGVGRRRFLAGLGAGAVALGARAALGQEKGPT